MTAYGMRDTQKRAHWTMALPPCKGHAKRWKIMLPLCLEVTVGSCMQVFTGLIYIALNCNVGGLLHAILAFCMPNEIAPAAVFDGHGGHSAADYMSKNLYKILSVSIEDDKKDGECQIEGKLSSHQMQGTPFDLLSLSRASRFTHVHNFCHTTVYQSPTAQSIQQSAEHAQPS